MCLLDSEESAPDTIKQGCFRCIPKTMRYNPYSHLPLAVAAALAYEAIHEIPTSYSNAHIDTVQVCYHHAAPYNYPIPSGTYIPPMTACATSGMQPSGTLVW